MQIKCYNHNLKVSLIIKNTVFWDVSSVDLVRNDVSEERIASIIRVTRISELGKHLAATSNRRTQRHSLGRLWFRISAGVVPQLHGPNP
jgi:hypothetical protein